MLIKYQALAAHLKHKDQPIYVLQGSDPYLLNDATYRIKKSWRDRGETDEKIIDLNTAADWNQLIEEANSYSLFSELVLIEARFEKKSIDAASKAIFNQYLQNMNLKCVILLQVNAVPAKQLQWLSSHAQVTLIQIFPFDKPSLQHWISTQLNKHGIQYSSEIPALIHQYTQGNMLACAQLVDKLALIADASKKISIADVREQLIDQCEYQLYELADACLSANAEKSLHLLQLAYHNKTESTLILWLLTQEIRHLIQLIHARNQNISFSSACEQQKIWPQRAKLYEKALARLSMNQLYGMLQECQRLDGLIKTSKASLVWQGFERLTLALSGLTKETPLWTPNAIAPA